MKTFEFNFSRKQQLTLVREIIYTSITEEVKNLYIENFVENLMRKNNCSSKEELYNKIDEKLKSL